jgi:hypothetical protein
VGAAWPQGESLQIAKLVEYENWVITSPAEMAVVGAACSPEVGLSLESMSNTMTRGCLRWCTVSIHRPGRSAKGDGVLRPGQPLGLEAAHLAGRSNLTHWRPAADHQRIAGSWHYRSASFMSS